MFTIVVATGVSAETPTSSPNSSTAQPQPTTAPRAAGPCAPLVDVCDVLDQYAALTHLKQIRDNFVQGKLSFNVAGLPPEKAIDMIERTLFCDGYSIVQVTPDTVQIVGTGRNPRNVGVPVLSDPKELPTHERVISYVFGFKYRDALEMQKMLGYYVSPPQPYTSMIAEPKSNTVLVTERSSVIRTLIEIAKRMDVPDAKRGP